MPIIPSKSNSLTPPGVPATPAAPSSTPLDEVSMPSPYRPFVGTPINGNGAASSGPANGGPAPRPGTGPLNPTVLGPPTSSRTIGALLSRPNAVDLQHRLHTKIIGELRDSVDLNDAMGLRQEVERLFNRFMAEEDVPLTVEDLMNLGALSQQAVIFLEAAVRAGLNVLVAGGTSSGKTTLLNVLSSFIPSEERIITIEDAAELQLQQVHVIRLESRPQSMERQNSVTIRDLVVTSLRMRPDRIIVGECRDAEALDMLQAMNTGHDGCMTTVHSNSPRDAISRIETMSMMARAELPLRAIREQISAAFDLIVYMERLDDGTRKVTYVSEVQGFEQDTILMQDVFRREWVQRGDQQVYDLIPTGIRPQVMRKLEKKRIFLAPDFFVVPIPTGMSARNGR
jgi:type IV secretory pathway ATPase VirB11/archaellum biosynthesis ATPase